MNPKLNFWRMGGMMQLRNNSGGQHSLLLPDRIAADSQRRWVILLEKISTGDQSALDAIYQDTSPLVFGLILRIVTDRSSAEDVLLEVFKQVWREAALFDAQQAEPLEWILTIARSRAIACLLSNRRKSDFDTPITRESLLSAPQTELGNLSVISQQQKLVGAALASLTSTQREVIELAYYGALSPGEIASRLGIPLDAVKKHLRFAMMTVRDFLSPVLQEQL
jgi:RNA polymerase sigma-70 factor (ECF subfamily)